MYLIFKHKKHDNDISANSISLWTRSDYIHASIVFNNNLVSGSWKDGVQWKRIDEVIKYPDLWLIYEFLDYQNYDVALNFFNSQVGNKFDYASIFYNHILPFSFNDKEKWYCSEITTKLLQILYPNSVFSNLIPEQTTPGDLVNIVQRNFE